MSSKSPAKIIDLRPYAKMPECPAELGGHEKKEWKRVAPVLFRMGRLTKLDHAVLEAYCVYFCRWKEAQAAAAKAKRSRIYRRQKLTHADARKVCRYLRRIAKDARRNCRAACSEFGFRFQEPEGMDLANPLPLTGAET